jgi:Holliday junction resolvase
MTPETAIKKQIKDYLKIKGWLCFYNLQGLGSYPGIPDLTAIKDGRVLQIEVKTLKGKQSAKQVSFQADWEAFGGEYVVVRSYLDVEDAIKKGG